MHAEHVWWFPEEEGPDFGCFRSNANLLFGHEHFDPDSGAEPLKCLLCRVEVCAPPPEKSKEHGERKFVMFLTSVSASRPCPAFTAPLLCAVRSLPHWGSFAPDALADGLYSDANAQQYIRIAGISSLPQTCRIPLPGAR